MENDYKVIAHIREADSLIGDLYSYLYDREDASPADMVDIIQDAIVSLQLASSELSAEAGL